MSRLFILLSFCLVSLLLQSVKAGDEDMLSPYSQFDPETGFYLPVDEFPVDDVMQVSDHETTSDQPEVISQDPEPDQANDAYLIIAAIMIFIAAIFGFRKKIQSSK